MARMNMSGVAASALLVGLVAASPRVLVKVVDINGDAVPKAEITITGNRDWDLTANNGGVARIDLYGYEGEELAFTATSPDGNLEGTTETFLRKTRGMNVVRVVVEEVVVTDPVPVDAYIDFGFMGFDPFFDVTITAEEGTFQNGDIIVVYINGEYYSDDLTEVSYDGSQVSGSVPYDPFPSSEVYIFSVVPGNGGPSRIVKQEFTIY